MLLKFQNIGSEVLSLCLESPVLQALGGYLVLQSTLLLTETLVLSTQSVIQILEFIEFPRSFELIESVQHLLIRILKSADLPLQLSGVAGLGLQQMDLRVQHRNLGVQFEYQRI